ncbi:MAG: HlyD family efflux transporter periplasmic adaptor subunit [Parvibaculum sp.]
MRLLPLLSACLAALLLFSCGRSDQTSYQGYAEGEYVRIGPIQGGTVAAIPVQRGDKVVDGALLFQMDQTAEIAAQKQAAAQLAEAQSRYDDLNKGLRASELEQIKAARSSATAQVTQASADLKRKRTLYTDGNVSKAVLDAAQAANDAAVASLREINARLATGKLAARVDQIDAAAATVKAAQAALDHANWQLAQREGRAPADGSIEDVYYRVGEMVGAGQPIVSLLPPANIKIRFFIPEGELARVHAGDKVMLTCDECPKDITATVRFIAAQAEFTPPVIYSENAKSKLVYKVEATPDTKPEAFHPGEPITVTLTPKAGQ